LPEIKDTELHLAPQTNIVLWLLEVDSIGLAEIQGRLGVKYLVLVNLQYGKNFSSNNKTIGVVGDKVSWFKDHK
jgi:hypothetical protein